MYKLRESSVFRQRLLLWYAKHARTLSWRNVGDPYRVWVSEVMLQQTTTQTVEGYFSRFVAAFPTVQALAEADLDTVNRLWEGLGYYRRCSQLHQAAKIIVADYGGVFPNDENAVRKLPGIGRYTANAVLSIAFDKRLPILEANTQRLYARLTALQSDPKETAANEQLWQFAAGLLPKTGTGHFNQALMDIGNQVCTPKNPNCLVCPIREHCRAAALNLQDVIPLQKAKVPPIECTEIAVLVKRRGKILLMQYPAGVRWSGLWDFPRVQQQATPTATAAKLSALTGNHIILGDVMTVLKHSVTKYRITLQFCEGCIDRKAVNHSQAEYETRWLTPDELPPLPMHSTARKLCAFAVQSR
ncbi:A/G-specific adenine glycosylase [Planctomycetales bacterium]|nr:A/G-specific adenine glycosylase [Planctomycetales bacterium]